MHGANPSLGGSFYATRMIASFPLGSVSVAHSSLNSFVGATFVFASCCLCAMLGTNPSSCDSFGATVMVASHELERAGQLATRQLEVVAGQVHELGAP